SEACKLAFLRAAELAGDAPVSAVHLLAALVLEPDGLLVEVLRADRTNGGELAHAALRAASPARGGGAAPPAPPLPPPPSPRAPPRAPPGGPPAWPGPAAPPAASRAKERSVPSWGGGSCSSRCCRRSRAAARTTRCSSARRASARPRSWRRWRCVRPRGRTPS